MDKGLSMSTIIMGKGPWIGKISDLGLVKEVSFLGGGTYSDSDHYLDVSPWRRAGPMVCPPLAGICWYSRK